jgi:hypothetical protein
MNDNLRQYRAIHRALTPWYPNQPTGRMARHVNTLAALISGIVASRRTQPPSIASKVPCGAKPESRVQRFSRWLDNDHVSEALYFLPYAEALACLALEQLVLVIDGSTGGRGCVALMVHVVYTGRALSLAWLGRQGNKGHVPASWHMALIKQVQTLIPAGAKVVLLGNGAFDGIALQQTLEQADWSYVCRTTTSLTVSWQGDRFRLGMVGSGIKPGCLVERKEVRFTAEAYGPITAMCCWAKGDKAPLYLSTNWPCADTACRLYEKRFRIGGCFRGVDLLLDGPPKFVPIDEEPNHQIMHALRLGETDGAAYQPFDPRPYVDVLALDLLGVFLSDCVLLGLHMTFVGTPAIGIIACEAKRLQQRFQLQKDRVLASSEHRGQHLPRVMVDGMPQPPRIRFAAHVAP